MRKLFLLATLIPVMVLLGPATQALAAGTPAGTSIENQAFADYEDAAGNPLDRVYSNTVTTLVTQVAAVDVLPATASQPGVKGTTVDFGARVVNLGNGEDTFTLSVSTCPGWTAHIYLDANANGVRDAGEDTELADTGLLAADAEAHLVVQVFVDPAASLGATCDTTLTAASIFDSSVTDTGVYTVEVQDSRITADKTVDPATGVLPETVLTYAITVGNTGTADADNVVFTDAIPAAATFVPGSIRLGTPGQTYGDATALTDALDGDAGNYNATTAGAVTVSLGTLSPGTSKVVFFKAAVDAGTPSGTNISNTGVVDHEVAGIPQEPVPTNTTISTVGSAPAVSLALTGNAAQSGDPGDTIIYPLSLCNQGNVEDVFDLSYDSSQGWSFTFWLDADANGLPGTDGDVQLSDTDSDGLVDTGPLAQDACLDILAVVVIPPGTADTAHHHGYRTRAVAYQDRQPHRTPGA